MLEKKAIIKMALMGGKPVFKPVTDSMQLSTHA